MVIDTISHSGLYHSLGPRFAAGLEWLRNFEPATPDGRYDLRGDDVFALVQSYETMPPRGEEIRIPPALRRHSVYRGRHGGDPLCTDWQPAARYSL